MVIIINIIIEKGDSMIDSAGVRKQNMHFIRQLLWQGGQYTKLDISKKTSLSVATCNTLLNQLEKDGEVIGEKCRINGVGRSSIQYHYNEDFETFFCVSYQLIAGVKSVRVIVVNPLGTVVKKYEIIVENLAYVVIEKIIDQAISEYPNVSQILVGTPSIAEHGIVRHCDVKEMEEVPLVSLLTDRFKIPVYMQNDIHFKAYGYYKKEKKENEIVSLVYYPANVLPGTATVYKGTILKGTNQFAGMLGFLPYDFTRKEQEQLLSPQTAIPIITKAIASLIVVVNPSSILFAGDLLDKEKIKQVYEGCLRTIPEEYMPEFDFTDHIDEYYLEGMYQKALDLKGDI